MKQEIRIPEMGESVTAAVIGSILKPTGSHVRQDDEILELETDKVNQVLYAPASGILELTVKRDDMVKIGDVIGWVEIKSDEKAQAPIVSTNKEEKKPEPVIATNKEEKKQEPVSKVVSIEPAPVAIPAAVSSVNPHETRKRLSPLRRTIAARLLESVKSTAMLTTFNEVDMTAVMDLREKYKDSFLKTHGVKLGFMSFFVKAVVAALKAMPSLNSYIDGDDLVERHACDIGIAVSTEKGLVVPVIRGAEHMSLSDVEKAIAGFAAKAREGKISLDDLVGGSFTITNGGVFGSLLSTPIINPPQAGILGMHKIQKRAVVVDDTIVIRPMMYLAVSYDHRVVDGKEAVGFLVHIKNEIEDPSRLILDL
jgi:2-oxoglutarate dehydrogenase complex dihydrolipoamide succinyltransferase (E2 component)